MRLTTPTVALAGLALALGAASCASNPAATAPSATAAPTADAPKRPAGQAAKGPVATADAPAPPPGAQFTVYCLSVPGAGHVPQASQLRDRLARSTGMRDWYVIHGADESTLYYGYYKAVERQEDPKEAARARADREKIKSITDASGARPFANALLVELTAQDPDAPANWDLRNAPKSDAWSLQVAAYEGHPDRKKYAVDAVKAFRDNGVPAYYYHGETVSSVCVGAWPPEAVRGDLEPAYNDPNEKRSMDQIMSQAPTDLLVVAPGLPPLNKEVRTKTGKLRAVSPHLEAVDPTLLATMKAYPHHYVNGVVEAMKTAQGVTGKPSLLVKIPRRDNMFGGGYGATVAGAGEPSRAPVPGPGALSGLPPGITPAAQPPRPPSQPPADGFGRLRSIEDR